MLDESIDPASLNGDALRQWYQRSADAVERARQQTAARQFERFFYAPPGANLDRDDGVGASPPRRFVDPDFAVHVKMPPDLDPEFARRTPPLRNVDPGFATPVADATLWPAIKTHTGSRADGQAIAAPRLTGGISRAARIPRLGDNEGSLLSQPSAHNVMQPLANPRAGAPPKPAAIDPSRRDVFQAGPDGKLHPIPGWHTTGPFDFGAWSHNIDWGGVARDLGELGTGVATFFGGVGMASDLLAALGPEAEAAIADGIAESPAAKAANSIHGHHAHPKYMGGAENQERVPLEDVLHRLFHSDLAKALRAEGFPPVGGKSGSTFKWADHFDEYPGSREKAMEILRRISREFDEAHGTDISSKLPLASDGAKVGPPPPK